MSSIRIVLGLAASLNLEIEQMDVKTDFFHCDLEEEIYMEQPEGFKVDGKKKLYANSKRVSMASNKLPDSGTKSLNLLWGSKAIRRLLQIIAYLHQNFLTMILSSFCCMWMIC